MERQLLRDNTIRLVEKLSDEDLETGIKRLNLEPEFLENVEERTGRLFVSFRESLERKPEATRKLAREFIALNFVMYPGAKKYLRMSFRTLRFFIGEEQTRLTPAAKLAWDLRLKYET